MANSASQKYGWFGYLTVCGVFAESGTISMFFFIILKNSLGVRSSGILKAEVLLLLSYKSV